MESVGQEILHKTATEIKALAGIMSRQRFIELTGKIPVEMLDQSAGEKVLAHLRQLSVEYHNTVNDVIETIEDNQQEEFVNPRRIAEAAARKIVDRRSREIMSRTS